VQRTVEGAWVILASGGSREPGNGKEVIGLVGAGVDTADIAAATLDASKEGLEDAARDPALLHSFWLLTQIPLCARQSIAAQG
jgi:hypothetical protein